MLAFGQQPRCMHGLRPGDRLAGACFPRVDATDEAPTEEPPLVGTSLLPRLALTLAHQLAVASGGGGGGGGLTLSLWWRLFLWTQAFEVPVYGQLLLASPAGAGEMARALAVGAAASALSHPAACILYVLLLRRGSRSRRRRGPSFGRPRVGALARRRGHRRRRRGAGSAGAREIRGGRAPSPAPPVASEGGRSPDLARLYLASSLRETSTSFRQQSDSNCDMLVSLLAAAEPRLAARRHEREHPGRAPRRGRADRPPTQGCGRRRCTTTASGVCRSLRSPHRTRATCCVASWKRATGTSIRRPT